MSFSVLIITITIRTLRNSANRRAAGTNLLLGLSTSLLTVDWYAKTAIGCLLGDMRL